MQLRIVSNHYPKFRGIQCKLFYFGGQADENRNLIL